MSRERDIVKNSLIFTIGRVSAQFAGFLLLPLYSSLLTPEDYGIADLINTLVFLILPIVGVQLDNALFRFTVDARNDTDKQRELFSTELVINLIQIAIYAAVFFAARPFITLGYKDFLLINVVLLIPVNTLEQFVRGLGNNIKYSAAIFITAVSGFVINLVLVAGLRMGVMGIIIGSAASQFLTLIYLIFAVRPWKYFRFRCFDRRSAKKLFSYSLPFVPNQLAWWVMGISDRLVISASLGVSANGIYSLANRFSSVYTSVSDSINLSWVESASLHINEKDRDEYISKMLGQLFVLFSSACFIFMALIPYGFMLINAKYSDAFMQIPILLIAVLCQAVVGIYSSVLVALKKTRSIAITSIVAAIVNFAVDICLVGHIGIYAGSVSTLAAFLVLAVLRCVLVSRSTGIRPRLLLLIPVIFWGGAVLFCYYFRNPYVNVVSLVISLVLAVVLNRKMILKILEFVKGKIYNGKHEKRKTLIYGALKSYEGVSKMLLEKDLTGEDSIENLLTYKDENWNYIKNLREYQKYLSVNKHPDWSDNDCESVKYTIEDDSIRVKTEALPDNWLCFFINRPLPDSYEISYDISINTEFSEVQLAFNYKDLGNRYRFMVKDNKKALFEAVYEGDFLEAFAEVPFSFNLGQTYNVCVRVMGNIYELLIDEQRVLAVENKGNRLISGDKACLILWNETDSTEIDCEIRNIRVRGL